MAHRIFWATWLKSPGIGDSLPTVSADKPPMPSQKTPKGLEIPVPTREEFLRNMDKVAPPVRRDKPEPEPADEQP